MRVLMISLDRGLLGDTGSGDAVSRHQIYADLVGALDIIVFTGKNYDDRVISKNLRIFSTKSPKLFHFQTACDLAIQLFQEKKYDLLVTQEFASPAGEKIKKVLNLPWIINIHSMFFSLQWLKFSLVHWYLFYRIKQALRLADGFRVTNPVIKSQLQSWNIKKPIQVQPTPVNVQRFLALQKPANPVPKVLFVGRLSAEKNLSSLLAVAKSLPDSFVLEIVGSGHEEAYLRALAGDDKRIQFLGTKNHDQLIALYRDADIFVLPSDSESFGKVLIEAGAAGCALLATKTAGAESIIKNNQTGILVPVGDIHRLKESLKKLLVDRKFRNKLGEAAREMTKDYDSHKASANIINFWKQISSSLSVLTRD